MNKLLCFFGFHSWFREDCWGRECRRCLKRQELTTILIGDQELFGWWEDV